MLVPSLVLGKILKVVLFAFLSRVINGNEKEESSASPVSFPVEVHWLGRSILNVQLFSVFSSWMFPDHINELASDLRAGCKVSKLSYAFAVQKRR